MSSEEDQGVHEHVVEIANESPRLPSARRRSFATMSVAVCLGLAGVVTAFAFVRGQSEKASDRESEATQREQLLDGLATLGTVAAAQRTSDELRLPATAGVASPEASTAPPPSAVASPQMQPAPVQNVIVVANPANAPAPQTKQALPAPAAAPAPAAPSPAAAPNQTPQTPAPGSLDTVLSPVTYPASQACGLSTCNVDSVCCNASCGVCTAPGESCSQTQCG